MDVLTASNRPLTHSVFGLSRLIAESDAFQRRCGETDWIGALENRVKRWEFQADPRVLHAARPFALVYPPDQHFADLYAGGAKSWLQSTGGLVFYLTAKDSYPSEARTKAYDNFAAWVDDVRNDIEDKAGADDRLAITHFELISRPLHSDDKNDRAAGAYFDVMYLVHWGSGGGGQRRNRR